jgi:hypothetical protein
LRSGCRHQLVRHFSGIVAREVPRGFYYGDIFFALVFCEWVRSASVWVPVCRCPPSEGSFLFFVPLTPAPRRLQNRPPATQAMQEICTCSSGLAGTFCFSSINFASLAHSVNFVRLGLETSIRLLKPFLWNRFSLSLASVVCTHSDYTCECFFSPT